MKTIESDTPLLPLIIASNVVAEAAELVLAHLGNQAAERLAERAERHYQGAGGPLFAKRIRSKHGREHLYAFMRHWLAAGLIRAGVCRCQLPPEWGIEGTRPLDCKPHTTDR